MVAHTLQKLIAESEPCPMDDGLEADDQDILSQAGWHLTFQDTVASIIEAEIEVFLQSHWSALWLMCMVFVCVPV